MNLKRLNAAELFALWRVVSFPIILVFIYLGDRHVTAWLYMLFFSTDAIDGLLARLFDMESVRRARLDTLGDILYLLTGVLGYYVFETIHFAEHLFLLLPVLGLYLIQFILAMSKWGQPSTYHTLLAKLAAFVQVVFLVWVFFFGVYQPLFYLAVGISLVDALEDIIITIILHKQKSHILGLPWLRKKKEK
ncbi:CDP-alcohol phosphatidyltransferase family protein [Cesiribacter sp. SM1]|uniref:CDP-alcohol phosphatidyltransferase family protein n=1 Tax=Cesiribacter sp. SM1 TaxID=2861196 RepID=UPI001CD52887|nr:CDP-alcohol phosphatidyltransferase family protein [Cesiribacter sp. SM1]